MVDAWITYAKQNKISTPKSDGRDASGSDVLKFIDDHLKSKYNVTLKDDVLAQVKALVDKADTGYGTEEGEYILKIKKLIDTKLSKAQIRQLKRELSRDE